ncbi:unnamed protein product, partial [Durusdinium trenchii]
STSHSQFRPTFFVLHVPRVVSAFGQAMGSINPVAGGLVLIHGTPTQRRQLHRGELRGLLEDAQEDFPPRRRWPLWFNAFVKVLAFYVTLSSSGTYGTRIGSALGRTRQPR